MLRDQVLVDDAPADEMFLNDAIEHGWIALPIPRPFGIDNGDRAAFADSKAVHLAAQDTALLRQPELFQTTFQELPGGEAAIFLAALRVRLIAAEKNMPPRDRHSDAVGNLRLASGSILHYSNATTKTRSHEENNFFRSSSCFRAFVVAF